MTKLLASGDAESLPLIIYHLLAFFPIFEKEI
jgi:hypothetical protein